MTNPFGSARPLWFRILLWFTLAVIATTILFYMLGAVGEIDEADAATPNCPSYVLVSNPVTGGTYMADRCVDGNVASYDGENSISATAASSSYGSCRTVTRRRNARNMAGWTMFYVTLSKYWCWRNGNVTYKPSTSLTHGTTTFGRSIGYDDAGTIDKGTWNEPNGDYSHSWGTAKFKQYVPIPIVGGLLQLHDYNLRVDIFGYGNGGVSY